MSVLSKECEQSIVDRFDLYNSKRIELEVKLINKTGFISDDELAKEWNVTKATLWNWRKLGLKSYTPPIANSKKRFYRITDCIKFLVEQ